MAFGIIGLLITFALILHTIFSIIPKSINGRIYWSESANTFLDGLISNASKYLSFIVAILMYIFFAGFIQMSMLKGLNVLHFFGPSVFLGKMPFETGKTWLNGFLINTFILTMGTQGMLTYLCNIFPQYLRGTIGFMYYHTMLRGMPFFNVIYRYKVVEWSIIIMFIISCIKLLIVPSEIAKLHTKMEERRQQRTDNLKKDWKKAAQDIKTRDTRRSAKNLSDKI